ncbi:uncharacterized protein LOC127080422 [Lathyrus oleraceus]|uniref:uncharacterized protein LOC127080422 n=1 Tax=Pisum sativum TaxID=3888 RepID=UPI0021D39456|nr:uncharacterized protein LOC127080422 [Pisum sativum]
MRCERSGTYRPRIRKSKRDDTGLRKCECLFKLCGYRIENDTWKFNLISDIHNHALTDKLYGHPIVCHLVLEDMKLVSDTTLNLVVPENILASLKQKIPLNVSNIKQIYNVNALNKKVVGGPRSEMEQLLKPLEYDHYVSRHIVCEDKVIVRDVF